MGRKVAQRQGDNKERGPPKAQIEDHSDEYVVGIER